MTRLQQLEQLAARIAAEIDLERSRQVRIAVLGGQLRIPAEVVPRYGEVQRWARANGHTLTKRGRVPLKVRAAWYAEHGVAT